VSFPSEGELCAAWHLTGRGDAILADSGRPCVVMAHGIGGTKDSGLLPFAEAFAEAGLDVLLFDYRCFGESSGEPRQLASPARHRDDYRAAVDFARRLEGVDPDRIVLWGTSWSGGHVVYVAAEDRGIAAVISQTPDLDGLGTLREIVKQLGPGYALRLTQEGLRDQIGALRDEEPRMLPIVAPPGQLAAMSSEGASEGYKAIAGPTWRNEIVARAALVEAPNRASRVIDRITCPILIQIADQDLVIPSDSVRKAAWKAKGRVEVREYPISHWEIYVGEWRERAIADQLHFLRRHLARVPALEPAAGKA
jgi:pimeloyl-ACP methyl ester carboxylesterase